MESQKLTKKEVKALIEKLMILKTELEQLLEDEDDNRKPVELDGSIGRVTRIDAIQQQHMAKATHEANNARLRLVEGALKRIEGGSYGECEECGEYISYHRLLARPESIFCIECKEDLRK